MQLKELFSAHFCGESSIKTFEKEEEEEEEEEEERDKNEVKKES